MKRIKVVFIIVLTFLVQFAYSQDWVKVYPTWSGTHARWLSEHYDNGYLFLLTRYINGNALFSYVVKTNINGDQLWAKTIGDGVHVFFPSNLDETSDHGLILCKIFFF